MVLAADSHVHSEWSWDAPDGSMERTCARAVNLGLPAIAFTEHVDYATWAATASDFDERLQGLIRPDGTLSPPELDLSGYLECVQRCRDRFPELEVFTGVELGEPHRHSDAVAKLLDAGQFDRVLGSLHCLPVGQQLSEMPNLFRQKPAAQVVREYLAEIPQLISSSVVFAVLAHIEYAVAYWPAEAGPFDPSAFQDEFRHALRLLADSGRALEINTNVPVHPEVVRWWVEEGGRVITFGSDAHDPTRLARDFARAADLVEAQGFRQGRHPYDFWTRSS